jgi:maltooligosyltrehalose trehalohydrolase
VATANQTLSYGATRRGKEAEFRVWAPLPNEITLRLTRVGAEPQDIPMRRDGEDFGAIAAAAAGDRYAYILEDSPPISDPVSRFLREGVHGPSEIVDPAMFHWSDDGCPRRCVRLMPPVS